jgi:hypothetical protein
MLYTLDTSVCSLSKWGHPAENIDAMTCPRGWDDFQLLAHVIGISGNSQP